jgi:Ser/Thr protein kinase RdoA (MazF antagonist)
MRQRLALSGSVQVGDDCALQARGSPFVSEALEAGNHPYSRLTPDRVLDALASVGMFGDGRLLALNSYENRVYQVGMEDGPPLVVKFYRPERWTDLQILEEHDFVAELTEAEIPVVPALTIDARTLHEFEGFRFAVFARRGGRAPEFDRGDTLEWMGRFLGRIHAFGATRSYQVRPALDLASFGEEPRAWLIEHDFVPADLRTPWRGVIDQALDQVRRAYTQAGPLASLRLHGDCHAGNVLWTDAGPHFVDFDDSRMGPAIQDLWMLLSGERMAMSAQLSSILAGYEDFYEFDPRALVLIEPLRTLRLIHYSAWLARRWDDPAFPAAFPWFNTERYWQDRILEMREQIALMDEPWGMF